jgi:hypothetical protein
MLMSVKRLYQQTWKQQMSEWKVFGRSAWEDIKEEICNADETGVFYNMNPETFKFKGKTLKKHLTVFITTG